MSNNETVIFGLPSDIWISIFHLIDAEWLVKSVVPVSKQWRDYALEILTKDEVQSTLLITEEVYNIELCTETNTVTKRLAVKRYTYKEPFINLIKSHRALKKNGDGMSMWMDLNFFAAHPMATTIAEEHLTPDAIKNQKDINDRMNKYKEELPIIRKEQKDLLIKIKKILEFMRIEPSFLPENGIQSNNIINVTKVSHKRKESSHNDNSDDNEEVKQHMKKIAYLI